VQGGRHRRRALADIRRALWEKFVFLAAFSGMTSVSRQPIGVDPRRSDLRATLEAAIRESWDARSSARHRAADDFVAQQMKFADCVPAEMQSSMQNDLARAIGSKRRGSRRGRADGGGSRGSRAGQAPRSTRAEALLRGTPPR
jgi:ketopantoate reductase